MLTKREHQTYMLCGAVGFTPEEAADTLHISPNTVKVNIRRVKDKLNWHKASELSASAVCTFLNVNYTEIRHKILELIKAGLMVFIVIASLGVTDEMRYRRRCIARRDYEVEIFNYTI